MAINLEKDFIGIDTILNDLLSKYKTLRFIGFDQTDENKPYYLTDAISKGFYYKAKKLPVTGELVQRLKFVPISDDIYQAFLKATMLELSMADGTFTRFRFKTHREPEPPSFEWILEIVPNKQDKKLIA